MKLFLGDKLGEISLEVHKAGHAENVLILAHGAGAGMNHPFIAELAKEIYVQGIHVVRFNFPYIERSRKAPGSQKEAILTWREVIEKVKQLFPGLNLFISGKSYGGRMASHLLAENYAKGACGIIYFGFPLHAPGRDSVDRASHLTSIGIPQLFIQGTKDKLANIGLIQEVVTGIPFCTLKIIEDADHSFNVPRRLGISQREMIKRLSSTANEWMNQIALRS